MTKVVCFKHPQYRGESAPDLSCKMCCSMFVARIREDQLSQQAGQSFKPLVKEDAPQKAPASGEAKQFDSSWI